MGVALVHSHDGGRGLSGRLVGCQFFSLPVGIESILVSPGEVVGSALLDGRNLGYYGHWQRLQLTLGALDK